MTRKTKVSLTAGIAILAANMVGTGIYTSLGNLLLTVEVDLLVLFLWILGGIVALSGAFCYSELVCAIDSSGGEYAFITDVLGNEVGFIAGWVSIFIGFAGPIALTALALSDYILPIFVMDITSWNSIWFSILCLSIITIINLFGLAKGIFFQLYATYINLSLIIIFCFIIVIFSSNQSTESFAIQNFSIKDLYSTNIAIAFTFVSFSYSGWNAAVYIYEDLKNPIKNIPKIIIGGTVFITIFYFLLNFILLYTTPHEIIKGKNEVALVVANFHFGTKGALISSFFIGLGLMASLNAMTITGPRVLIKIASDHHLFKWLTIKKNDTPIRAILFQFIIAVLLIIVSNFRDLLINIGIVLSIFTCLTVFSGLILRYKKDNRIKYKMPLFPLFPLVFLFVELAIIFYLILDQPIKVLYGLIFASVGLFVYWFSNNKILKNENL